MFYQIERFMIWARNIGMNPQDVALESFRFWRPLVRLPIHAFALLGCEDGETSFRLGAVGDKGEAFGPFQWHQGRIDAMRQKPPIGCGIDIKTATHADQLQAAFWEMNHGLGYRHVWESLNKTSDIESAVSVLVVQYEHSALQSRDILRRTALANKWAKQFGDLV